MLNNRKVKIKTQRVGGGCVETNEDDFFLGGVLGFSVAGCGDQCQHPIMEVMICHTIQRWILFIFPL